MSTSTSANTIPKIRTYATDLNDARAHTGATVPTNPAPTQPVINEPAQTGVIPPFHTFNHPPKNAEAVPAKPTTDFPKGAPVTGAEAQAIISSSSTKSQAVTEALPAVIITDTKHKRFSLTAELKTSLANWWHTKQEDAKKRKVPKYTVPDAERRKGVIQKATAQTGRASTSDHAAVLSKIREAKQIPHTPTVPSAPPVTKTVITPSWGTDTAPMEPRSDKPSNILVTQRTRPAQTTASPTTPVQSWNLPSQNITKTVATATPSKVSLSGNEFAKIKQELVATQPVVVPRKIITAVIPQPIIPTIPTPTITPTVPTIPTPPKVEPISRPKIMPIIPVAVTPTAPTPVVAVSAPTVAVAPAQNYPSVFQSEYSAPDSIRPPKPTTPERRFAPPRPEHRSFVEMVTQTNSLVFISFGVLIFIVVSGLSLRSYLAGSNLGSGSSTEAVPEIYTTFSNSELAPTPTKVATKQELITALTSEPGTGDSLVEITIIDSITNDILTPTAFFALLDAPVLFDFKASVTNVAFGNYRGTPWITLTITDRNTALGGMLDWEKSLDRNLSPLFDTDTLGIQNGFTDGVSNGTDVRMLKGNSDETVVTYGFITNNTILITGNDTAFLNLATTFRN